MCSAWGINSQQMNADGTQACVCVFVSARVHVPFSIDDAHTCWIMSAMEIRGM